MAERNMSGKALLDNLYRGLDTMPAAQAERDARDLRSLTDDLLGKPAEPTAPVQRTATAPRPASDQRSGSRAKVWRSSLLILGSVALAGTIAAGALRESDKRAALPPPPAVVAAPEVPPPAPAVEAPPPEPVVLTNPFDASEKFTFPPGTSRADARDQMATLLLQRAAERRAHAPRASKLAAEPRKSSTGHGS